MPRLASALFPALALIVLVSATAEAGLQWCPRDPIVALNGQPVQIWVAIPEDNQAAVSGPIEVRIATPRGVAREVLFTDEGFNGHGETVEFFDRGVIRGDLMEVDVRVRIPYDRSMIEGGNLPVLLTIVLPDGTVLELEDDRGRASTSFRLPVQP